MIRNTIISLSPRSPQHFEIDVEGYIEPSNADDKLNNYELSECDKLECGIYNQQAKAWEPQNI